MEFPLLDPNVMLSQAPPMLGMGHMGIPAFMISSVQGPPVPSMPSMYSNGDMGIMGQMSVMMGKIAGLCGEFDLQACRRS